MAPSSSKTGLEDDHNPWAPAVMPDLLSSSPSPSPGESPASAPEQPPPQYSDAQHSSTSRASYTPLPTPKLPFHKYIIPESSTTDDKTTTTTYHPPLYSFASQLLSFLTEQIHLPPKPTIRILGKHRTYSHGTITDFDLHLNLTALLIRSEGQSWSYLKFPPPPASTQSTSRDSKRSSQSQISPPQSLPTLSTAFTSDPSAAKSLTLSRSTPNLDTAYLTGQILALLSTLQYAGSVTVTFPTSHSTLTIQKGTPLGQTWRSVLNTAASWVTLGKAPVKPTSYSVEAVWPFATTASHAPSPEQGAAETARKCAVQSEVEWWGTWRQAVQNAVLSGRKGWVGNEDWTEAAMGWRAEERKEEWGASDGGNGVR